MGMLVDVLRCVLGPVLGAGGQQSKLSMAFSPGQSQRKFSLRASLSGSAGLWCAGVADTTLCAAVLPLQLSVVSVRDIGPDYAITLRAWRDAWRVSGMNPLWLQSGEVPGDCLRPAAVCVAASSRLVAPLLRGVNRAAAQSCLQTESPLSCVYVCCVAHTQHHRRRSATTSPQSWATATPGGASTTFTLRTVRRPLTSGTSTTTTSHGARACRRRARACLAAWLPRARCLPL